MNLETFKQKIINKENDSLSYKELETVFNGYINEEITDEQMTEILKLICKYELKKDEIISLVDIFIKSGEQLKYDPNFIDKHSTGGVGDKTTLIVLPILASLGVKISKMSGRALGYTGGTIDKLESINVKTNLTKQEFYDSTNKIGMVISSQTENLCPMDKKIYALRDVTGTTKSISLIASSIMSKKIASGAGKILIDVKVGHGALVETEKEAEELANLMIEIGKKYNREVICMLTRMDNPLGNNIGNTIEIKEVLEVLRNKKHNDLTTLVIEMSSLMYNMITKAPVEEAKELVKEVIKNGKAYNKFKQYVISKGGNIEINLSEGRKVMSEKEGYIKDINAMEVGKLSMNLGAGRKEKTDKIDFNAGIILNKKKGDYVKKGELLATIYGKKEINEQEILKYINITEEKPQEENIIIEILK